MTPAVPNPQRIPPQRAQGVRKSTDSISPEHLMPGLIEPLVDCFGMPRKYRTIRGVQRLKGVTQGVVASAILHFLLGRNRDLEARMNRIEENYQASTVRNSIHVIRRAA